VLHYTQVVAGEANETTGRLNRMAGESPCRTSRSATREIAERPQPLKPHRRRDPALRAHRSSRRPVDGARPFELLRHHLCPSGSAMLLLFGRRQPRPPADTPIPTRSRSIATTFRTSPSARGVALLPRKRTLARMEGRVALDEFAQPLALNGTSTTKRHGLASTSHGQGMGGAAPRPARDDPRR